MNLRIIYTLLLLCLPIDVLAEKKIITVAYIDKNNPPFVLKHQEPDAEKPGITIDILRILEQRADVKFIFKSMPWARCLDALEDNQVDAIFHSSFNKERMKLGVYPMKNFKIDEDRRLLSQTYYIYKHKQSPLQWDGKNFIGLKEPVGTIIGFSINNDLARLGVETEVAPTIMANLLKLMEGRIAVVINYASQTDITIENNAEMLNHLEKLKLPFKSKFKYLMFSRAFYARNPGLVESIWDELKLIRTSGEMEEIITHYMQ